MHINTVFCFQNLGDVWVILYIREVFTMPKRIKRHIDSDDISLLDALRNDTTREAAFRILFEKNIAFLQIIAYNLTEDLSVAKDIVQSTFITFWEDARYMDRDIRNLRSYLVGIAKHLAYNYLEKHLRRKTIAENIGEDIPKEEKPNFYKGDAQRLIARLPEPQQKVLYEYFILDKTAEEVAAITGLSIDAVHSRIYRARKTLKKLT